jgi:hypothetical protein
VLLPYPYLTTIISAQAVDIAALIKPCIPTRKDSTSIPTLLSKELLEFTPFMMYSLIPVEYNIGEVPDASFSLPYKRRKRLNLRIHRQLAKETISAWLRDIG